MNNIKDRLVIVIPFAIILIIFSINSFIKNKKQVDDFSKYSQATEGTVINYTARRINRVKGSWTYKHNMTIEYEIDNEKYRVEKEYEIKKISVCKTGDKIEIHYDPNNPQNIIPQFYIENEKLQKKLSKVSIIIAPILAIIFLAILPELKK